MVPNCAWACHLGRARRIGRFGGEAHGATVEADAPLREPPEELVLRAQRAPHLVLILDDATQRTAGSFVEEKTASLAWHYRAAAIVAIGDDRTDEDLSGALPTSALTIHVGGESSCARYRLADPAAVRRLLRRLMGPSSALDLPARRLSSRCS